MSSRARRPRADQPNSAHWESHKETLRHLYLEDNHPLKTVREIMQQHHDFNATDKMYKYHFKRWKFRKNMTQREAQRHEADAVAGRGVALPFAFGRELGSQRLKLRIMKLNCPMKLNSPDAFNQSELALRSVVDHSRERLKSWDIPNYEPSNSATESWAHEACLAGLAICASNEAEANYRVLSKAALDFNRILQKQEPMLVWSTCTIVIQLFEMDADLAFHFIRVVLHFCKIHLQDNNPLLTLWKAISRTNPNDIRRLIAQIAAAQMDFLRQEIGTTNSFVVKYIKSSAKYLHDRKLLEPFEAHRQMDSVISALQVELHKPGSDNEASTKNQIISANLFKACIYLDNKQWSHVGGILERVEPEVQADFGIDPAQVVNFYEIKAEMLRERGNSARGDYFFSERYYKLALRTAQQRLSEAMPGRIGYLFMALVELYKRAENVEKLEETQAQYDEHVKMMAGDVSDLLPFAEMSILESEQDGIPDISADPMEEDLGISSSPMDQVSKVLSCLDSGRHTIEVYVDWELPEFVSQGLDSIQDLATVMTITGKPDESYISSCESYVKLIWGETSTIFGFFQAFIYSNLDFKAVAHERTIFSSTELNVSVTLGPPAFQEGPNVLTFQMTGTKHHLIETCQCILWLAATCRPPGSGSMHTSVARFKQIGMQRFGVDTELLEPLPSPGSQSECPYCWLNMFDSGYVLAQGFPTPSREYGRGLELPLDIMIDQAMAYHAISHTINGQDCIILKGRYTALVPIYIEGLETPDKTNEVQWHLVGRRPALIPIERTGHIKSEESYDLTDLEFKMPDHDLSWEDIDDCGLKIFPIGSIQKIASKRSFVGHFPKAQILVGTDKEVYNELEGGPRAKTVEGKVLKFGQAINLTLGTNAATGGLLNMSASTTIKRSKFDPVPHQVKVLIADKLRHDLDKPHILYDISKRVAWMVPEACLVLYLIHYWAVLQSRFSSPNHWTGQQRPPHPGQDKPGSQPIDSVREHVPFIQASYNAAVEASKAILGEFSDPSELPKHIRFMDDDSDKLVYVRDIIRNMYLALDTLVEHQKRRKPGRFGRFKRTDHDLCGYDLADVAGFGEVPMKSFSIDKERCGGWNELTDPDHRIVVLFGNNFGELIKYDEGQMICGQWRSVPPKHDFLFADSGTLEYLQKRKDRSGRSNVYLTDKRSPTTNHGQKQCQEEEWPCCNMALQLTSKEPETIFKFERGQAVVIGKATRSENQKSLRENIWKRNAPPGHAHEERHKPLKQSFPQYDSGRPGTCSMCTEDNQLEIASSSENSSPEGAEIDLSVTSGASSSNTPQSGWA